MDQPLGSARILVGDAHHRLAELRNESVHCIVTSPPYFGLRDYGTETWHGGDPECDHRRLYASRASRPMGRLHGGHSTVDAADDAQYAYRDKCLKCGARRIDQQIGLNDTVDDYIDQLVSVFRELWRVLRKDGIAWLNLGDSYAANRTYQVIDSKHCDVGNSIARRVPDGLKPKDLIGVPWRVAFALQADGWYLRSDIIWEKINCMPESVRDRPTRSHEYIFMLTKSERYYYDADAIAEPSTGNNSKSGTKSWHKFPPETTNGSEKTTLHQEFATRNRRSVWRVSTKPFKGAHFATFPPALIEPCILAGSPVGGTVLDPFCGAGTVLLVAAQHGRQGVGVELNPDYARMAEHRLLQAGIAVVADGLEPRLRFAFGS